jgi:glycosyltransferase involved in cell wall biosynthesis
MRADAAGFTGRRGLDARRGSERPCYVVRRVTAGTKRLDMAVLFDAAEEEWPSMDLAGEMLIDQWRSGLASRVDAEVVGISIPRIVRRLPGVPSRTAFNADRALTRYVAYPVRALAARRPRRLFHVVDHSYAQLVHSLPAARTGVYCHDLDVFQPILSYMGPDMGPGGGPRRSRWFRALARVLAAGLRAAAVIFHNTREVGRALERSGLVPGARLVHAPLGVAPEYSASADPHREAAAFLAPLGGRPFVLHVGSGIPRKRIDVLFEVFAKLRATRPDLRLVQQGAALSPEQRGHAAALGITDALVQPPRLTRNALAGVYQRAAVVLVPSEAEGFGIPVIEALACGTPVVASDIATLREVGGDAVLYAPPGDVPTWTRAVEAVLDQASAVPSVARRRERAADFTWERHARTILDAYDDLASRNRA